MDPCAVKFCGASCNSSVSWYREYRRLLQVFTRPRMQSDSVPIHALQPAILLGPLVKAQLQAGRRTRFSVMLRLLYPRANIQYMYYV